MEIEDGSDYRAVVQAGGCHVGSGTIQCPIRDIERTQEQVIRDATLEYSQYEKTLPWYGRMHLEGLVRLGDQMVISAGF